MQHDSRLSKAAIVWIASVAGVAALSAPVRAADEAPGAVPAAATGEMSTASAAAAPAADSSAPVSQEAAAQEPKKDPVPAADAKSAEGAPAKGDDAKPDGEKKDGEKKEEEKKPLFNLPKGVVGPPLGAAGPSRVRKRAPQEDGNFLPFPDRWRIPYPDFPRYGKDHDQGATYHKSRGLLDPFNQNVLKGDYPINGQNTFLELSVLSETLWNSRSRYTPSGTSAERPGAYRFFGGPGQVVVDQTFLVSTELFHGDTAFKPKDWAFRFTPAFNVNFLNSRELGVANVDIRRNTTRTNLDSVALQEAYGEYKVKDLSRNYDFMSLRAGVQPFNADFRGFLLVENAPGFRLFGNSRSNRRQFNLVYLRPWEKDTYSRLNRVGDDRQQDIFVANYYLQDLFRPGYTGQVVAAYNHDRGSRFFSNDNVQVRPTLIGAARVHDVRVGYVGLNGDGHFGRINVSHSFYQAFGVDELNPVAGKRTRINAQMAAAEISYDRDWYRLKSSFFYASGDSKPNDNTARGFDAIVDNPNFIGGPFSFINGQGLRLTGTGADLFGDGSLLPSLRGSKLHGQGNFVNPGVMIVNLGTDVELTPKWRASANISYIKFLQTKVLETVLNQNDINSSVGWDFSLGLRHRPFLNDNVIFFMGASVLKPSRGVKDVFQDTSLYSFFTKVQLAF